MGDDHNVFIIRYGPATIFSNEIPGLDVNFINPKYTETSTYKVKTIVGYDRMETWEGELEDYCNFSGIEDSFRKFANGMITILSTHNQIIRDEDFYSNFRVQISFDDDGDARYSNSFLLQRE